MSRLRNWKQARGNTCRMTKVLINLTAFFACAHLGASLVLFTGVPLALLTT